MKEKLVTITMTVTTEEATRMLAALHGTEVKSVKSKPVLVDEDEDDEVEEVKPAKKSPPSKKKPAVIEEDDDDSDDDDNDNDIDDDDNDDDDNDDEVEESKPSKGAISEDKIVAAFRDYAKKHSREKAIKILKSFGVTSVKDLQPKIYKDVLTKLAKG